MSDRLQQVSKPLLNADTCSQQLGALFDRRTMMCAGRDEGGAGACFVRAFTYMPLHTSHWVNIHHYIQAMMSLSIIANRLCCQYPS